MSCQRVDPRVSEAHCGYTSFYRYVIMKNLVENKEHERATQFEIVKQRCSVITDMQYIASPIGWKETNFLICK